MICHTEDYKCYQKDLAVLKEQEELYRKFKEFRGKSLYLQLEKGQEQYFEKIESLHSEYKDVLDRTSCGRFSFRRAANV